MKNKTIRLSKEVSSFLDAQNHPLRKEIDLLREIILTANNSLVENIKWNGPNYSLDENDFITMKLFPPKQIQLIFHCGAKPVKQPPAKLIQNDYGILEWKDHCRAVATFKIITDLISNKENITALVQSWLIEAKKMLT
ncbi:MAG: DUF1801 domain-containing protein [Lacibacter sp.]